MHALTGLRGRAAYWEKRIDLEKSLHRKGQLEVFAWAELARLTIREGMRVYSHHSPTFESMVQQACVMARNEVAVRRAEEKQFGGSRPLTGSRRKKSGGRRARAAEARQ